MLVHEGDTLDARVAEHYARYVEEAAESWMAAEHEGKERAAEEISQLLYHAQVLMLATGIELDDKPIDWGGAQKWKDEMAG